MNESRTTLGRVAPDRVKMWDTPRLPPGVVETLRKFTPISGLVADNMDKMGLTGVIPGSRMRMTLPGASIVGPAITLRNVRKEQADPYVTAANYNSRKRYGKGLGEVEAYNITLPGDVMVIDGVHEVSNMGGISASIAKRQGQVGAIVDGAVRDIDDSRRIGFPIWSTSVSPLTGKWRVETIEINGPVEICGVRVSPGDLVVADDTGICFCPRDRTLELVERVLKDVKAEEDLMALINAGVPLSEIPLYNPRE